MLVLTLPEELLEQSRSFKREGKTIALVPTMGNLHKGHLQLVSLAKQKADIVIVTIFVNPLQFGKNEDLTKYPTSLKADLKALEELNVDIVFTPSVASIYPKGLDAQTSIHVPHFSEILCAISRPTHFDGVATVVAKLFNMSQPDFAIFGEKDKQQLLLIKDMVKDLSFPIEIIGAPTVREVSGLALSSRNSYLNDKELIKASRIKQILDSMEQELKAGILHETVIKFATSQLESHGFEVIYLEILDPNTLKELAKDATQCVIMVAVTLNKVRLIDNILVSL